MANAEMLLKFTVTIVIVTVDEIGYLITSEPIDQGDMLGIVEQLMAEKKGLV